MAFAKLSDLLELKPPAGKTKEELKELSLAFERLNPEYGNIYLADGFKGEHYNFTNYSELKTFLNSLGFPENTPDKYYGLVIAGWYEKATTTPTPEYLDSNTTRTDIPENLTQTTINERSNEGLFTDADKRNAAAAKTRENATTEVKRAQDRLKEIYEQQQKIQEEIQTSQKLQPKYEGKTVYVTVEQQTITLKPEVQQSFETLSGYATYEATRTDLVDQLAEEIQLKAESDELFAKTMAVRLVNDLASPEIARTTIIEAAIEEAVSRDQNGVLEQVLKRESDLIATAKKGAVLREADLKDSVYLPKEVAENIFGKDIAEAIYRSEQIKVILSSEKGEQTTHQIDLATSNRNLVELLNEKESIINNAKEFGIDKAKGIFTNNVNSYLAKQAASAPEGSILRKAYSSSAVKAILNNGLPGHLEWKAYNQFGSAVLKYYPQSAPYLSLLGEVAGVSVGIGVASKIVPLTFGRGVPSVITAIQPIRSLGAPYTLGVKTGAEFTLGKVAGQAATQTGIKAGLGTFIAKGAAAIGISSGVFTAGVSTAITAVAIGLGKLINWPKIKKWFRENRTALVGVVAGGGLLIGGPAVGGLVLFGGLAATGTLGSFATGAFSLFGFIGRSIGVAIATPVIVTLLVLPPLVAFIMLVINNSAYVVPPSPVAESGFDSPGGGGGFSCTAEKTPTSISSSVNSSIATRAWEIMEDMYQGFWCYWNRSPGDYSSDQITAAYKPHYPELFDEKLFARSPNPTREEVSSCGSCLFWCTWLVQKSYAVSRNDILYTLWSPAMYEDFKERGKILTPSQETATGIEPGAVVFFDVDNGLNRIDHVGVVHSVNAGGVTFLQSNAGTKDDFIPFGSNGLQDLPGITVVGIGNP